MSWAAAVACCNACLRCPVANPEVVGALLDVSSGQLVQLRELPPSLIGLEDAAFAIQNDDGILQGRKRGAQEVFGGDQGVAIALPLGDILDHANDAHHAPGIVARHFGALVHPLLGAADADSVHEIVGPFPAQRRPPGSVHILMIVGVHARRKSSTSSEASGGHPIYAIGLGGAVKPVPSHVESPAAKLRHGLRSFKLSRGLAKIRLGQPASTAFRGLG